MKELKKVVIDLRHCAEIEVLFPLEEDGVHPVKVRVDSEIVQEFLNALTETGNT